MTVSRLKIGIASLALPVAAWAAYGQPSEEKTPRQNVALSDLGTTATATDSPLYPVSNPAGVIDGNLSDDGAVRLTGVPAEIMINFFEEREVNRVRVYPGLLDNQMNAGAAFAPLDFEIEGYVNDGWAPLAKVVGLPQPTAQSTIENYFFDYEFPSTYLSKLRLRITRSGDSGKRLGTQEVIPPGRRTTAVREIQVFESSPGKHRLGLDRKTADFLSGDFRLPYYRNQTSAQLDLFVKEQAPVPPSIVFHLRSSDGTKEFRQFTFPLQPGKNGLVMDISGLPTGRYLATGVVNRHGEAEDISRLLRIDNGSPSPRQQDGADLTGKILYPIDDYHVESRENLSVNVNPAEPHFVAWARQMSAKSKENVNWLNKMGPLSVTKDNELVIPFQNAEGDQLVWQHAICPDPQQPERWEIRAGPVPEATVAASASNPARKWTPHTPIDRATFRFYEKGRDGDPPLNEIHVLHTGTIRRDFGGLPIAYRGTYPVWEKRPGEILFLSQEPLLQDITLPGGETFEREKDTSDNFGGQLLSEDGKTYFYFVGNVVKRFPPYIVPYDNQRNSNRLLSVYYTHDGFHWEKQFILPLTEKDPWSLQQYGAAIFKDPHADIYWGYLSSFNCEKQQMDIDIVFSRDLLNWTRPGDRPFIPNSTVPDTWLFGLTLPSVSSFQVGNHIYLLMSRMTSWAHFYPKLQENTTPEFIRQRYDSRGIKQWPYFETVGGYPGLSKSIQLAFTRRPVGIAVSRPNGYVCLTAGEKAGILVTRPLRSGGILAINASTDPDGWVQIDLLSPEGISLAGCSRKFQGDELNSHIFEELPSNSFKIKFTLKNARVFSLHL